MKLREYFLCTKKTKIINLFNNFFASVSVFDAHSREYYDTCAADARIGILMENPDALRLVYKQRNACMRCYSREHALKSDTEEKKLLNELVIFVFFVHRK